VVDQDLWATGAACLAIQHVVHSRVLLTAPDGRHLEADPL
jgi:hypothetical protein